jgi:Rho-binding antiterminator
MITCSEYDYIELACLFHYPVKLTMKAGESITGIARDTVRNAGREECLLISVNKIERSIVLTDISKLEVLIENDHFTEIVFE